MPLARVSDFAFTVPYAPGKLNVHPSVDSAGAQTAHTSAGVVDLFPAAFLFTIRFRERFKKPTVVGSIMIRKILKVVQDSGDRRRRTALLK